MLKIGEVAEDADTNDESHGQPNPSPLLEGRGPRAAEDFPPRLIHEQPADCWNQHHKKGIECKSCRYIPMQELMCGPQSPAAGAG